MGNGEEKLVTWDNKIGMATVVGIVQIIIVVGVVILSFGSVKDATENSKAAVTELRNIVETMRTASTNNSERVTRVEERTEFVVKQLDRIEHKVDTIQPR